MNEKTEVLLQKLEQGVKDVFDSNRYKEYLNFVSKFHKYSYFNTILILCQREDATSVAGYKSWNSMNRQVKRGEKGIAILAPSFSNKQTPLKDKDNRYVLDEKGSPVLGPVTKQLNYFVPVHVFDVSQTDGDPLPAIAVAFEGEVEKYDALFDALQNISPYPVYFQKLVNGANGYCDYRNGKIIISETLSQSHALKTFIHEVAHARLHVIADNTGQSVLTDKKTTEREIEAESVAYVVCQHLSIDTSDYSFDYIANWSKDQDTKQLKAALSIISKEANSLISEIENILSQEHQKLRAGHDR